MNDLTVSQATLEALGFDEVLRVVAVEAVTDLGRSRIGALRPVAGRAELERRRRLFAAVRALVDETHLVPRFEEPLAPLLERMRSETLELSGLDLLLLADLLAASSRARRRITEEDDPDEELVAVVRPLVELDDLVERIRRTFDSRGEIRDDATPRLAELKETVRERRDDLYSQFDELVERHRDHLSEETVPMRDGRLVLLLSAGDRGRVPGLVHGRSGSEKSFYVEPLEAVEGNNRLQEARAEIGEEKRRIVAEILDHIRRHRDDIDAHAEALGTLDLFQASTRFAAASDAQLAAIAGDDALRLVEARHPLLDPELSDLRRRGLERPGHRDPVVPLDLELTSERRVLVVTGPNAGGKTVALKTCGLFALMTQAGLPVPSGAGTELPLFTSLVATVGDEQDLMADRSTFSGRLRRVREAWECAGPGALTLLDELGSGTDPEEGAALSGALVEGLTELGGLAVVTTHLVQVAAEAMELPGAGCAAMAFDAAGGEPLFRLEYGPPGGSEALRLARRMGLDVGLLERAERRVGDEGRRYRRLIAEVESLRDRLAEELAAAEEAREEADDELERLESERRALDEERRQLGRRLNRRVESFRTEVREEFAGKVERLRDEIEEGRRRGLAVEATERLFEEAPEFEEPVPESDGPLVVGAVVTHRGFGWEGTLEAIDDGRAEISVRGKTVRCGLDELVATAVDVDAATSPPSTHDVESEPVDRELRLLGQRVDPALDELDRYLDRALLSGHREVRVVHGHGTGALRDAVRDHLAGHALVGSFRRGDRSEGGNGATVVTLGE